MTNRHAPKHPLVDFVERVLAGEDMSAKDQLDASIKRLLKKAPQLEENQ